MRHNDAIEYLQGYPCVCEYGDKPSFGHCNDTNCRFYEAINSLKPERPHGKWIKEVFHCVSYRCSECATSYHVTMFANFNFCPHCGADMRTDT